MSTATRLFAEQGFQATSLRTIAAANLTAEQTRVLLRDALEVTARGARPTSPSSFPRWLPRQQCRSIRPTITWPGATARFHASARSFCVFEVVLRAACFTDGIDPALATRHLIAILDGSQIQWLLAPDELDVANEARSYLELVGIDLG